MQSLKPGNIVISTALASRGTDLSLMDQVNQNGGLHVLLTCLPKDSRTERQIIGRTGRRGLPGSYRLLLYSEMIKEQLDETFTAQDAESMKAKRDAIEAVRVDNLNGDLQTVLFQEELFSIVCNKLEEFKNCDTFFYFERLGTTLSKTMLVEKWSNRKLGFTPSMDALKEKWAMWYSINSAKIQEVNTRKKCKQKYFYFIFRLPQILKRNQTLPMT